MSDFPRLEKNLSDILKLLRCGKTESSEVEDFFTELCNEFPAYKKSYKDARNISSLRKELTKAAKHAAGLGKVLADPLILGTLHMEAFKDARTHGERVPSLSYPHALADAVTTLNRLLNSALTAIPTRSGGDNKKLGILPPKRWIVVLCADVFQRYRNEEAAEGNSDFLDFVALAWHVVDGGNDSLNQAVKDAMPEVKAWTAAMKEVRGNAS